MTEQKTITITLSEETANIIQAMAVVEYDRLDATEPTTMTEALNELCCAIAQEFGNEDQVGPGPMVNWAYELLYEIGWLQKDSISIRMTEDEADFLRNYLQSEHDSMDDELDETVETPDWAMSNKDYNDMAKMICGLIDVLDDATEGGR